MPQARACCLEGERLAEPVSCPVAYGHLPLAGIQLAEVRGSSACSTVTGRDGPGSAAGRQRYDGAAADELVEAGRRDPYTGPAWSGTEVDNRQVAGSDEAVDSAAVDVQGGDGRDVLGYAVALDGDHNETGEPVWYSGSKLAPDLSLPRIRKRFTAPADEEMPAQPTALDRSGASAPLRARYGAVQATDSALTAMESGNDRTAAAHLIGVGEVIGALAQTTHGAVRSELQEAARHFERAAQSRIRAENEQMYALRRTARQIIHSGPASSADGAGTALLLDLVMLTAVAAAHWHTARGHAQQAEAAQRAALHLRAAYQATAAALLAALRAHGERLPSANRQRHTNTIRTVLPHLADRLLTEPGWGRLTAVLDQAERAGHDTTALLAKAAGQRELDSAESVGDTLVWRLHHLGYITVPSRRVKPKWAPVHPVLLRNEAAPPRRR